MHVRRTPLIAEVHACIRVLTCGAVVAVGVLSGTMTLLLADLEGSLGLREREANVTCSS